MDKSLINVTTKLHSLESFAIVAEAQGRSYCPGLEVRPTRPLPLAPVLAVLCVQPRITASRINSVGCLLSWCSRHALFLTAIDPSDNIRLPHNRYPGRPSPRHVFFVFRLPFDLLGYLYRFGVVVMKRFSWGGRGGGIKYIFVVGIFIYIIL